MTSMNRIACRGQALILIVVVSAVAFLPVASADRASPQMDDDGTLHAPGVTLPESVFLSKESRAALKAARERAKLRLLTGTGAYGASSTMYQTEIQTFANITSEDTTNGSFRVSSIAYGGNGSQARKGRARN